MTIKILLWFNCKICNTDFLSYCYGNFVRCHIIEHEEGICFYDNTIGEIHNNNYFHCIKELRKCRKCSKANQLEEFI